jgi:hypothetical protein
MLSRKLSLPCSLGPCCCLLRLDQKDHHHQKQYQQECVDNEQDRHHRLELALGGSQCGQRRRRGLWERGDRRRRKGCGPRRRRGSRRGRCNRRKGRRFHCGHGRRSRRSEWRRSEWRRSRRGGSGRWRSRRRTGQRPSESGDHTRELAGSLTRRWCRRRRRGSRSLAGWKVVETPQKLRYSARI